MALPSPLIPDARHWIAARQAGYEQGEAERRRNLLLEAGQLAAASPMQAPATAAVTAQPGGDMGAYSNAISSIESGGRYDAIGPVTRSGDRAYGKYQVMGANIPAWTKKHLGREMTPQQFLADKDAQEKVFSREFGGYVGKYGNPQDAASMWFSGRPAAQGAGRNDGYTSQPEYLRRFNAALGGGGRNNLIPASQPASVADPDSGLRNASNALLRGGDLQAGLTLQNQIFERNEKARALADAKQKEAWGIMGELALRADTPEKWARVVEIAKRGGLPVAGLEDFANREMVLARSGKAMDYMSSGKRVFNKTLGQYVPVDPGAPNDVSDADYSKNPVYGVDAQGNTVILQLNDAGQAGLTKLPEGVRVGKDPIRIDAGTETVLLDPVTRQRIGSIPKDVAGEAAAAAAGKGRGEAQVNLPTVRSNAGTIMNMIDGVLNDPYLPSMTGPIQGRMPNLSGNANRVQSKVDQLQGQAFLQAFNSIRGGGQITEAEGSKATVSLSRLQNMNVNDPEYPQALKDFKAEVLRLVALAEEKAGGAPSASSAPSAPSEKTRLRFNPETGDLE